MFECKVCKERNLRIEDLKKELEFLKRLLSPSAATPIINLEENFALDGASTEAPQEKELSPEEQMEKAAIEQERDAILSGNY